MNDPLEDGAPGIGVLTDPMKSPLKGLFGHELRPEDDARAIVFCPVRV